MAANDKKALEEQTNEYEKIAQEKFNKILAAYRQIIDGISPDHFKMVDEIVGKETKKAFNVEKAGNIFKEHLFELIKKKFTKTWSELGMNEKLVMLEYGKHHPPSEEKWRPTNKTADEQCNAHVMKILAKQRATLQHQIEFQNKQISMIVPQIEMARQLLKHQSEKRSTVMAQIKQDLEKMREAENVLRVEVKKMYNIADDDS